MTIGWNADKYGDIDLDDLKTALSDPKFAGTVALNGKPYDAGAAQKGFLAIALVVGLAPIYRFLSTTILTTDAYWLAVAYVILVMLYAYRALDSGRRGST